MKRYIVTRIAQKNPKIKGKSLYFANSGVWTLDKGHARLFYSEEGANEIVDALPKLRPQVEVVSLTSHQDK